MKRLFIALLVVLLPIQALAITTDQYQSIIDGTEFYDPGGGATGGGGGCLTLALPQITDPAALASALDNFIKSQEPSSPLIGLGSTFVQAGSQYGINPAYMVAISRNESSYGTAVPPNSDNPFGLTAVAGEPSVQVNSYHFAVFPSWAASIPPEAQTLQQVYLNQGLTTVTQVTDKYDPPDAPGNSQASTDSYIASLTTLLGQIVTAAGSSLSCGGGGSGTIVQIAQQELALHLVGTGPLDNGGPVCKYEGSACNGNPDGEAWCADFVSWVYNQAGTPFTGGQDGGWRLAGAAEVAQWFQTNGVWVTNGPSAPPPQPGDVFYDPAGEGHVGIIESVSGNSVTTIEGNAAPYVISNVYPDYHTTGWAGWGRMK